MQLNSRSGEVGAAVRGQPDQAANSRNESTESAYFCGSSQDQAPGVAARRPQFSTFDSFDPRIPELLVSTLTFREVGALTDYLIALREIRQRVTTERAAWPVIGSLAIEAWEPAAGGDVCFDIGSGPEPLPSMAPPAFVRVAIRGEVTQVQAAKLLREIIGRIEGAEEWEEMMSDARASAMPRRDGDDPGAPF